MTVYVSLPQLGPRSTDGRDASNGVRLAYMQADGRAGDLRVHLNVTSDATGRGTALPMVAVNARRATSDSSSAAYIGELDSAATRTSMPITNQAGLVQVSPGATAVDLTRSTPAVENAPDRYQPSGDANFARVIPDDDVVRSAAEDFAGPSSRPVLKGGVAGWGTADRFVLPAMKASRLPGGAARFRSDFEARFGHGPGPYAAYGYEAMRLVLNAITAAAGATTSATTCAIRFWRRASTTRCSVASRSALTATPRSAGCSRTAPRRSPSSPRRRPAVAAEGVRPRAARRPARPPIRSSRAADGGRWCGARVTRGR